MKQNLPLHITANIKVVVADLPEATKTPRPHVDDTIEQLGITTQERTDCACVFKFNCFKPHPTASNIAHVSGTKAKSTLTCAYFQPSRRRLKGMAPSSCTQSSRFGKLTPKLEFQILIKVS